MKSESEVTQSCPIFCNPWTVACQAPPSMGFSKQEYWNGLPFPSPGDLPDQGIEPKSPIFWEDSLSAEPQGKPIYTYTYILTYFFSWWWLSSVWLFVIPQTVARQASLCKGFSKQEYWNGLPFPSAGDLPDPGIKPGSPTLQADSTVWATKYVL